MWWLLLIWPLIGWIRLYIAFDEMCKKSRRLVTLDMQAIIMAGIFPFFKK